MVKRFAMKPLLQCLLAGGLIGLSSSAMAAAFQLWEQDGASVGDYHAGRAAVARDASTALYNPAGITRIKNQQLVLGYVGVASDIKYQGLVSVNTLGNAPQNATAQAGSYSPIPDLHYVAPINDRIGVGLSIAAPFGLKTDYGRDSVLRYTATNTQMRVVDISPSVGLNIFKNFSVGLGLDWQRMSANFNQTAALALLPGNSDTTSVNTGRSYSYGFHAGAMYQIVPSTRVGVNYVSQVVHHLRGTSKLVGPVANRFNGGQLFSANTNVAVTLPASTTLSVFHQLDSKWALMGTAVYTQWSVFKDIKLQKVAAVENLAASTNVLVTIPAHYKNTWNFSVGSEYAATDKFTIRDGIGFDQSPVTTRFRNVQIPDANRYAVALGGHYQANKALGFDLGYTHLFMFSKTTVNPPPQAAGAQIVATNGTIKASADVFAAQVTWNIA